MLIYVVAACSAVLLFSNIWLLREVDGLKARLKACREEVTLLDNQLCRIMIEIRENLSRPPGVAGEARGRMPERERTLPRIDRS